MFATDIVCLSLRRRRGACPSFGSSWLAPSSGEGREARCQQRRRRCRGAGVVDQAHKPQPTHSPRPALCRPALFLTTPIAVLLCVCSRDATVALVGFTSWMAVCWKLSRMDTPALGSTATEALLALVSQSGPSAPVEFKELASLCPLV